MHYRVLAWTAASAPPEAVIKVHKLNHKLKISSVHRNEVGEQAGPES